jgi:hypothetical protein
MRDADTTMDGILYGIMKFADDQAWSRAWTRRGEAAWRACTMPAQAASAFTPHPTRISDQVQGATMHAGMVHARRF